MEQKLTIRQRIMKWLYPTIMKLQKKASQQQVKVNSKGTPPPQPFHHMNLRLNNASTLDLSTLQGKKVLIVNTASDCGFTGQYAELQELYERHKGNLEIIGVPANDFKEQEKSSDEEIARFCQVNFGVTFPLAEKASVVKGPEQHPLFRWLSDPAQNGWNSQPPVWNFSKYLISEQGVLTHYFPPGVSPVGEEVVEAVKGERGKV